MSEYSPGPWVCEAINHALGDTGDVEGCMHVTDAEGKRVIEIWGDDDKAEANATLIAAAPELLEALRCLLPGLVLDMRYAREDDDKDALLSRVRTVEEAIAKATAPKGVT